MPISADLKQHQQHMQPRDTCTAGNNGTEFSKLQWSQTFGHFMHELCALWLPQIPACNVRKLFQELFPNGLGRFIENLAPKTKKILVTQSPDSGVTDPAWPPKRQALIVWQGEGWWPGRGDTKDERMRSQAGGDDKIKQQQQQFPRWGTLNVVHFSKESSAFVWWMGPGESAPSPVGKQQAESPRQPAN